MARTVVDQHTAQDEHIPAMRPFKASAMAGMRLEGGALQAAAFHGWDIETDRLPARHVKRLSAAAVEAAMLPGAALYIVYSYRTPIAWRIDAPDASPDGAVWTVPDVKYSPTTTHHQRTVDMAAHWAGQRIQH